MVQHTNRKQQRTRGANECKCLRFRWEEASFTVFEIIPRMVIYGWKSLQPIFLRANLWNGVGHREI